jgi:hypothetical protein
MLARHASVLRIPVIVAIFFLSLCSVSIAQNSTGQIKAEIERLQRSLKENPISSTAFPEVSKRLPTSLQDAGDTLAAGLPYAALEKLSQATDLLQGVRAVIDKADVVKAGLPAFEGEWNKANLELASSDARAREKNWNKSSAALRAISETAQARVMPLLEGGRGFAVATKPQDGLFYIGEAQGESTFAAFVASLSEQRKAPPVPLRSYLPELHRLQEKTNTAFQPPRSIEQHSRFIALNSTLKLAGELDAAKSYAGALYQYLEATRHYGMLEASVPDTKTKDELKRAIATKLVEVRNSKQDDSVAQIFLERAQTYLSHPDGSVTSDDEWRSAQVVMDQVLPAYYEALKPAAPLQQISGKTVTLTLVRWPYT